MTHDPLDVRYARRSDLHNEEVVGEVLVLDEVGGKVHQLNASAGFVWLHCNGDLTVREIIQRLTEHFDVVPAIAEQDVCDIIKQLQDLDLISE